MSFTDFRRMNITELDVSLPSYKIEGGRQDCEP